MYTYDYSLRKTLLLPMLLSAKNIFFPSGLFPYRTFGLIMFCFLLCALIFKGSSSLVNYLHSQDELGIILSLKIFQMAWILIFAMLIFSCMVSAVSSIYLSEDNEIIFSAPIAPHQLFFMRYISSSSNNNNK